MELEEDKEKGERRRIPRFRHAHPVRFELKTPGQFGGCLSHDLNGGGVRVRFNDFVPLDTELTLQIHLADQRVVDCVSRVAWIEKGRYGDYYNAGLAFTGDGSTLDSRKKIREFLSLPAKASEGQAGLPGTSLS